jgi:hypothetical protein
MEVSEWEEGHDGHDEGDGEAAGAPVKCLLCLEPAQENKLGETPDLITSFVTLALKSGSKNFLSLPKRVFTEGMAEGLSCNACYNRLHELNFLQNKIKTLQESLARLEAEIETEILSTYYRQGDSPDDRDTRKVAELRRRFYKGKYYRVFHSGHRTRSIGKARL